MAIINHNEEIQYIQDEINLYYGITIPANFIRDTIEGYIKFVNINPGILIHDRDAVYYIIGYLVSLGYKNIQHDIIYYIIEYDYYYLESQGLIL